MSIIFKSLANILFPLMFAILADLSDGSFNYICLMLKIITYSLSFLLSLPVHFYRYVISPYIRPSCRHVPTCSAFMLDALKIHGPFRGFLLGTGRILRCRPGGTHGYDPVPLHYLKRYRPVGMWLKKYQMKNRLKR